MTSFMVFQADIARPMEAVLRRELASRRRSPETGSVAFDMATPFHAAGPPPLLTPNERFAVDSFQGFMEVSDTLQRLFDIAVYVGRYPF
ncbi:MAG: hypothetical protein ACR2M1_10395 [Gemmatimonadaceae bacterium]